MVATVSMAKPRKGYKGVGMEGALARWYARNTASARGRMRDEARTLVGPLGSGSRILEVAPGPGYLAIELAQLGDFEVVGLDVSQTFVALAAENARKAGVAVAFHRGDAAALPFESAAFDLIVCRAAFKNFTAPVQAIAEMHRVLKPGGKAVIIDLRRDAAPIEIAAEVASMKLGRLNDLITRLTFKHLLLGRAYSKERFTQMAAQTPFAACTFREYGIVLEVSLVK